MATVTNDRVTLSLPGASSAVVHLFGATLISWTTNGQELLFTSRQAILNGSKAIRGGIPLVFPQFGPGTLPQHGFARVSHWTWGGILKETVKELQVAFHLSPDAIPPTQRALWSFDFSLTLKVTLSPSSLETELIIQNVGKETFTFTTLLHTYFQTMDIQLVSVHGLKGLEFNDSLTKIIGKEERETVQISQEVDRVYKQVPDQSLRVDLGNGTVIGISKEGFRDTVVWNPWKDKAKAMADFGDDEYNKMICVEVGLVVEPIALEPGETWSGSQILSKI